MYCISVNYKKSESEQRQRFSFTRREQIQFLKYLRAGSLIDGGVVLATCNRTELYVDLPEGVRREQIDKALATYKRVDVKFVRAQGVFFQGKSAIKHLMRVCAGLDSMILGEDEIFHQVKEAYGLSGRLGFTTGELNIIFQGAFNCAKKIKTLTGLSSTSVSYGTLAANEVERFLKKDTGRVTGFVLVIGATGKMGSVVAKNLADKGIQVIGTRRTKHLAQMEREDTCSEQMKNIQMVDFEKRYQYIKEAGAVVCATASPHLVIAKEMLDKQSIGNSKKLFLDLAVPYDIEPAVAEYEQIQLWQIDDFNELITTNKARKKTQEKQALGIVGQELEALLKKIYIRQFWPMISRISAGEWRYRQLNEIKESIDSEALYRILEHLAGEEETEQELKVEC
ncbi:MAG: glutamyl-tRNA reductase [Eubacterium sp.]|nr:glutamyl-tRNA reductase [Eubacterium sp.]